MQGPSSRFRESHRWPGDLLKSLARVATEKHMKGRRCPYHVGGKGLGVQGQVKVNFGEKNKELRFPCFVCKLQAASVWLLVWFT